MQSSTEPTPLWEHQIVAVAKAKKLGSLALFAEMGTGKTRMTIEILRDLYNTKRSIAGTLIFSPPVVVKNWKKEIKKFSKIPPERVILLQGSGKKRLEALKKARAQFAGNFLAVTNYEAVQMAELYMELVAWGPKILVCDEAHRLKDPQSLRAQKVFAISEGYYDKKEKRMLSGPVDHCFILTGTPVLNNPMDIFSLFRVLDQGRTFGKNFYTFRGKYFYDKNRGMPLGRHFPDWHPYKTTHQLLGELIAAKSFQARKADCLKLPPLVTNRIEVELGAEQAKAYQEMLKHFLTFVKENAVVAELAITKTLRLQQILAGFVRTDEGEDIPFDTNPRLSALKELLEDITPGAKVIVWANFVQAYRLIEKVCDKLGVKYVALTGEQTVNEKYESEERFEKDDEVRVLIGNPQAGGEGVNLVAASHMIYYTRDYSRKNAVQSEARNHRGGSERHEKITKWEIVAPETLDEVVLDALERKEKVSDAVMAFARGKNG